MGIVNDTDNSCTEFFNNSVLLNVITRTDYRCGIRCAGRNAQTASWQKPDSSRFNEKPDRETSAYRDLTRDSPTDYNDDTDKGIYTCTVDDIYKLHIGIYNDEPGTKLCIIRNCH